MEALEVEVSGAKKEAQAAQRDVNSAEKAVLNLESLVQRKQTDRHNHLYAAKINQITIPLIAGSLAEVDADEDDG